MRMKTNFNSSTSKNNQILCGIHNGRCDTAFRFIELRDQKHLFSFRDISYIKSIIRIRLFLYLLRPLDILSNDAIYVNRSADIFMQL